METPRLGPPPQFDLDTVAELGVYQEMLPPSIPPEMLTHLREVAADPIYLATDESMSRGGAYLVEDRTVPGPPAPRTSPCWSARRPGSTRRPRRSTTPTVAGWSAATGAAR